MWLFGNFDIMAEKLILAHSIRFNIWQDLISASGNEFNIVANIKLSGLHELELYMFSKRA